MANTKYVLDCLEVARTTWPDVPTDGMNDKTKTTFLARKKAVDMYIDGYKKREIIEATGNAGANVLRYIDRCLVTDPNGCQLGYAGLVPHKTVNGYGRNHDSKSTSGEFEELLRSYPELRELIIGCAANDPKYVVNKNMSSKEIHEHFIKKCRELGIQESDYPLCTITQGRRSLEKYIKRIKFLDEHVSRGAMSKDAKKRFDTAGYKTRYRPFPCFPYSDVQVDGHKLDVVYVVKVDDGDGRYHYDIAMRPWVFTVLDLTTVTVLGYYLTQNEEYDATDVLKAIRHAILPKKQYALDEGSVLQYPANGGWPDTAYPILEHALWDTIMMDNALSHQAKHVVSGLVEGLGMTITFGPAATPVVRPNVERFFGTIEREALHRLPYTVGSSANDMRRNEGAKAAAIRDQFTLDKLQVFLDVAFCNYNNSPNRHNRDGVSPLESIRRLCIKSGMLPVTADKDMLKKVEKLHWKTDVREIRGSIETGRRPYFQFARMEYRSDELSKNFNMLTDSNGKPQKVIIRYDPDDISTMEVYTANTYRFVGIAHATGKWNFRHTEKQHKEMLKIENDNNRIGEKFSIPVDEYVGELQKKAKKSRRDRTKADIASKTIGKTDGMPITEDKERKKGTTTESIPFLNDDWSETTHYMDEEEEKEIMKKAASDNFNADELFRLMYHKDNK